MDFGFEAAGFKTRVAVEFDDHCAKALSNTLDANVIHDDIHCVEASDVLAAAGLERGECDLLIGGPPCQPFSKSGYWARGDSMRLEDPRSHTLTAYLRMVAETKPKAFVLENVAGLAFTGKDEGLQFVLDQVERINIKHNTNYRVSYAILNCADFGVPQRRERIFIVANRDGIPFKFPTPTHGEIGDDLFATSMTRYTNAWDAIGDLDVPDLVEAGAKVGGKWGNLLPSIPEGENYLWHTSAGGGQSLFGYRTRYWSFLLKLAKRLPSWTIQAQPGSAIGPFHWKNRKLTFHEMCRLQTFPDGLKIDSGRTEAQRMVGNAVPSLMAEILGREIKAQFFGQKSSLPCVLLPTHRSDLPAAETPKPMDAEYLHLVGFHSPHRTASAAPRRRVKRSVT